jgi:hypothetical protein
VISALLLLAAMAPAVPPGEAACPRMAVGFSSDGIGGGQFGLHLDPAAKLPLHYRWTITGAELVSGQGTPHADIGFALADLTAHDVEIVATVVVEGLPKGCANVQAASTFYPRWRTDDLATTERCLPVTVEWEGRDYGTVQFRAGLYLPKEVHWSVTGGSWRPGGRPSQIVAKADRQALARGVHITATVKVDGMPEGCADSATTTANLPALTN